MPTERHQRLLLRLFDRFREAIEPAGIVLVAALRLRLGDGWFREPDVLALLARDDARRGDSCWTGADLVAEVVSPTNRAHDLTTKRSEYAAAGIPEYWIVDPDREAVVVLRLEPATRRHAEHGAFGRGQLATSARVLGLRVDVAALFDAG